MGHYREGDKEQIYGNKKYSRGNIAIIKVSTHLQNNSQLTG